MEFEWANLLRADRRELPWLFEHTRNPVRGLFGTLWKSLFPGRFWNAVQLWHEPRLIRLWFYVFLCGGGLLLMTSLLMWGVLVGVYHAAGGIPSWSGMNYNPDYWERALEQIVLEPAVELWRGWQLRHRILLLPFGCFWAINLSWPLMMLVLRDSRREVKVKRSHVLRAWTYSLWWGLCLTLVLVVIKAFAFADELGRIRGWNQLSNLVDNINVVRLNDVARHETTYWISIVPILGLFAWTARWWWVVIVRYWKFSQPGLVYKLIFVVSLLAMLIPGILGLAYGRY